MNAIALHLASMGVTTYTTHPANGCTMVCYGRVVAYYYVNGDTITDIIYD
jgi:hypothetical protein